MTIADATLERVQYYYGQVLKSKKDLKTSACCTAEALPARFRSIAAKVHPEVLDRFYGCGTPIPEELAGLTVLDLGCGTGRDCFLLSHLVGPSGRVIGVDMTGEQLAVARQYRDYHATAFGYPRSNVDFFEGFIEDLTSLGIEDESVDLVVSNCVINLSPEKERVFREVFRVLKPGGELYFSDVFSDRRVPEPLKIDPVLTGECLAGAMYLEDFRRMLAALGCLDYRVVSHTKLEVLAEEIREKIGAIGFHSMTIRAFKLALEDRCEDYGQVAYYQGSLPHSTHAMTLDDHHVFETGRAHPVCGNTADMLTKTRFAPHFQVVGDRSRHFGLFDCSAPEPKLGNGEGGCC